MSGTDTSWSLVGVEKGSRPECELGLQQKVWRGKPRQRRRQTPEEKPQRAFPEARPGRGQGPGRAQLPRGRDSRTRTPLGGGGQACGFRGRFQAGGTCPWATGERTEKERESSLVEQDPGESGRGSSACGSHFLRPALKAQGWGQWGQGAAGRVERPGRVDSIKWGQHRQGGQAGQVGPPSKSSSENEKPVLERRACAFVLISFYDIIISRQKVHAETPRFH